MVMLSFAEPTGDLYLYYLFSGLYDWVLG